MVTIEVEMWLKLLCGDKNEVNITIQVLKDVDGDEKVVSNSKVSGRFSCHLQDYK